MGDCRLYRNWPFRDAAALCVRMDGRESRDRGVFSGQRVDLGAHEAVVYPVSRVHGGGVYCLSEAFRNFFAVKAASILLGLVSIPALFYTLTGMFGKLPDWVNITIFFLADALLYFVSYRLLTDGALRGGAMQLIGFVLLWALLFAFVWFTYRPLHLPLFLDPVSGCYGLETPC